ncbi:MAG TPA: ABC transporter permease [Clostridiales bacterium]|nr:ABC transporter permease [Clostridiales bacterium]
MTLAVWISFLAAAFNLSAVFLFGSTGEIVVEKSGHLNLGIPGVMSVGAAAGCMTVYSLMKAGITSEFALLFLPMLSTILAGGLMGLLYSFMTVTLRANQNVTGLAMTTFGLGLAGHFMNGLKANFGKIASASYAYKNFFKVDVKLGDTGFVNSMKQIFLSHGFLVYFAIIVAIVAQIILSKTRTGLHLRAVGESPATADAAGINVTAYKYIATIIGCAIAALGGLYAIMEHLFGRWDYVCEGFGWLSIALVIFTIWRPGLAIPGSIIFGALYILKEKWLVTNETIKFAIKVLPYVMTIIVLIITSIVGSKKAQAPGSLGTNYFREER